MIFHLVIAVAVKIDQKVIEEVEEIASKYPVLVCSILKIDIVSPVVLSTSNGLEKNKALEWIVCCYYYYYY